MIWKKAMLFFQFMQTSSGEDNTDSSAPGVYGFQTYGNTLVILLIILVLWFTISTFLTIWTYRDIKKKQLTGFIYVPIVFLTSFIGLLIYYIVRYNEKCALEYDEAACLLEDENAKALSEE
ncbi:MAG TPA: hypothetical protein VGB37_08215 [Candidatus Lokiarchaeia archaeon]